MHTCLQLGQRDGSLQTGNRKISFPALLSVFAPAEVKLKTLTKRLLIGRSGAGLWSKTFSPPMSVVRGSPHRDLSYFVLDHLS